MYRRVQDVQKVSRDGSGGRACLAEKDLASAGNGREKEGERNHLSHGAFVHFCTKELFQLYNIRAVAFCPANFPVIGLTLVSGKPFPVRNCTLANQTYTSVEVRCVPGYDGGLPQKFVLEVYHGDVDYLASSQPLYNVSNPDEPSFALAGLEASVEAGVHVAVYAMNAKGRSQPVILSEVTYRDAEKRTGKYVLLGNVNAANAYSAFSKYNKIEDRCLIDRALTTVINTCRRIGNLERWITSRGKNQRNVKLRACEVFVIFLSREGIPRQIDSASGLDYRDDRMKNRVSSIT